MARRRRNPKLGNMIKWGVLAAAAFGGYKAYETIKGTIGGDGGTTDGQSDRQKCLAAGGTWMPAPTLRFVPGQWTPGYCVMPGGGLVRKTLT